VANGVVEGCWLQQLL
jgi:hypothetical protein